MAENKYFWLKLKKDFFKRHDIRIIESMPNGKDYILFYLKLLCESVDHEGNLRFSDTIPYNEEMLSTITNTNIDVVRSAIKVFSQLEMMELLNDGTFYMNEVSKMMGYETDWAVKKREYRERLKKDNVLPLSDKSIELELEKELELDIDKEKKKKEKKASDEATHTYGEYKRIRLKDSQYKKLCDEFGENKTKLAITKLDEYVQSNNNKNGYKDFYLVLRKVIQQNWFKINDSEFTSGNNNQIIWEEAPELTPEEKAKFGF